MAAPQLLSGSDAVRAAALLRRSAKEAFPFPWSYPPANSNHVFARGSVSVPLEATETEVLAYTVPNNLLFCPVYAVFQLAGSSAAAWVAGDGNVSWSITVNTPAGSTSAQGYPYKDYGNVLWPLGSFAGGFPWPINPGEKSILNSRDVIRISVTVNSNAVIPQDSGQFVGAIIGHIWAAS
jgi:hypothetical protein